MTIEEKILYHQIHPLKLLTDWSTGLVAIYLLWRHELIAALLLAFLPSILISWVLVRYAALECLRSSRFGGYIRQYMTRPIESLRFIGYGIMAAGGWFHLVGLVLFGLLVILFAWLNGKVFPRWQSVSPK